MVVRLLELQAQLIMQQREVFQMERKLHLRLPLLELHVATVLLLQLMLLVILQRLLLLMHQVIRYVVAIQFQLRQVLQV